jgi:D-alanyl-D-alanine carboxypeptidase
MGRVKVATATALFLSVAMLAACGSSSKSSSASTSTTAAAAEPAYAAQLRSLVTQTMKDNAIPGAVVMIKSPKLGDWSGTFGTGTVGENKPLSIDDSFRIGSNTKTMTSTVILQLVQEGKLKLDDPISKYISGVPNGDNITIANLSEMRSGLYSYTTDPAFNKALDDDPQKVWTPQELLDIGFKHGTTAQPGKEFNYDNTNIVLLGLVIEKLTGMSLADAFKKRIFEPLGMTHTFLPAANDASLPDPHPQGYMFGTNVSTLETTELPQAQQTAALDGTLKPNDHTNDNPSWAWAAGGAISTAGDLAIYVKKLIAGGLLDPQLQKQRLDSIQPTAPGAPGGYGLGLAAFGPLLGHDGQLPGFMTFMTYDPNEELTVIVLTNLFAVPKGDGAALAIVKQAVLPVFYPSVKPPSDPAASPTTAATGG